MRFPPLLSNALRPLAALLLLTGAAHAQMLTGWAHMPAATFADGFTSGQFAAPNPYGTNLPPFVYTLIERTVTGDPTKTLRIDEFDISGEKYTGRRFFYPLDADGTNIGDMVGEPRGCIHIGE